jgi:hypothetical protein
MFSVLTLSVTFAVLFVVVRSFGDMEYYILIGYIKKPRLLSLDPLLP